MKKVLLFLGLFSILSFIGKVDVFATTCLPPTGVTPANPSIYTVENTPPEWQAHINGIPRFVTNVTISSQPQSSVAWFHYSWDGGSNTIYDGPADNMNCSTSHTMRIGGLPAGTYTYTAKVSNDTSQSPVTGIRTGTFEIPTLDIVEFPDSRVPTFNAATQKYQLDVNFTTNILALGSVTLIFPNETEFGPDQNPNLKDDSQGPKNSHQFTIGSITTAGTYGYRVTAYYPTRAGTPVSKTGHFSIAASTPTATQSPTPTPTSTPVPGSPLAGITPGSTTIGLTQTQALTIRIMGGSGSTFRVAFTTEGMATPSQICQVIPNSADYTTTCNFGAGVVSAIGTYLIKVYPNSLFSPALGVFTGGSNQSTITINNSTAAPTPTPTPTSTPSCGAIDQGACCTGLRCQTNLGLYCGDTVVPICYRISNVNITQIQWATNFGRNNIMYDFNNDNVVNGVDYALWLKAGKSL